MRRYLIPGLGLLPIGLLVVAFVAGVVDGNGRSPGRTQQDAVGQLEDEYQAGIADGDIDPAVLVVLTRQAAPVTEIDWGIDFPVPDGYAVHTIGSGEGTDEFVVSYQTERAIDRSCIVVRLTPPADVTVAPSACFP